MKNFLLTSFTWLSHFLRVLLLHFFHNFALSNCLPCCRRLRVAHELRYCSLGRFFRIFNLLNGVFYWKLVLWVISLIRSANYQIVVGVNFRWTFVFNRFFSWGNNNLYFLGWLFTVLVIYKELLCLRNFWIGTHWLTKVFPYNKHLTKRQFVPKQLSTCTSTRHFMLRVIILSR